MNIPNILTTSRFFLTFIFVYLLCKTGFAYKVEAAAVFFIASVTDYLDGYYAKKHKCITKYGKLMDPIADKFLILTAFLVFVQMNIVALWMFLVIFVREFVITFLRLAAMRKGRVHAAERIGKYKTVAQIVAIYVILLFIIFRESSMSKHWSPDVFSAWHSGIMLLMMAAVVLTVVSGYSYLLDNRRRINA